MTGQQPQEVGRVGIFWVLPRRQPESFRSLTRRGGAGITLPGLDTAWVQLIIVTLD